MSRWFRFYSDAMRNPKVLRLSDKDFRLWVGLMAIASERGGAIPAEDDLRLILGMRLDHLKGGLDRLIRGGLIDALADGYEPHNWSKFQYKSDTSNERVAKHRAKRNVTVTPPDTDTDTDSIPIAKAIGAKPDSDAEFWASAKSYIGGKNPGGVIGGLIRDYDRESVASAIAAAQVERAVEPIAFIRGCLRKRVEPEWESPC